MEYERIENTLFLWHFVQLIVASKVKSGPFALTPVTLYSRDSLLLRFGQ